MPRQSDLYVKAVGGSLFDSPIVRELFLSVRKMPSDVLGTLLDQLVAMSAPEDAFRGDLLDIRHDLKELAGDANGTNDPFRSEHDIRHETLRTTVVAQKVEISKQKSHLSAKDSAYSQLVQRTHALLQTHLGNLVIDPRSLFLHEIFFYDLRSPHRDVFTPKPRHAIERALATPHDYLSSTCDAPAEGLSSTQPATAILYQLYLESGLLINVFDLWSAFYAIVGGEDGEDCDEANAM